MLTEFHDQKGFLLFKRVKLWICIFILINIFPPTVDKPEQQIPLTLFRSLSLLYSSATPWKGKYRRSLSLAPTNATCPSEPKLIPVPGTWWSPRPGSPVLDSAGGSGRWVYPFQHTDSYSGSDQSQTPSYTAAAVHLKWSLGRAWRRNEAWWLLNKQKWGFQSVKAKILSSKSCSNASKQI